MDTRKYSHNDSKITMRDIPMFMRMIPAIIFIPIMGIGMIMLDKLFKNFPEPYEDLDEQTTHKVD